MSKKKPKFADYPHWLKKNHGVLIKEQKRIYNSLCDIMKNQLETSDFWLDLLQNLSDYDDEYYLTKHYRLLLDRKALPEIYVKPFSSFLEKTYRKNILDNKNWPNEPQGGWFLPYNWFSQVNDILRTMIVVKYLDGVEFIIDKIDNLSNNCSLNCNRHYESRIDGYYAAHLYIKNQFEIPIETKTEFFDIKFELQITTQLQEIIKQLLYTHYAKKRKEKTDENWQWNYQSDEFSANNLGHILHYVEGMIMEVREKQKVKK